MVIMKSRERKTIERIEVPNKESIRILKEKESTNT